MTVPGSSEATIGSGKSRNARNAYLESGEPSGLKIARSTESTSRRLEIVADIAATSAVGTDKNSDLCSHGGYERPIAWEASQHWELGTHAVM